MTIDWDSKDISNLVRAALAEDIGMGDATCAATIPPETIIWARILAKESLVCAGLPLAQRIFRELDPAAKISLDCKEGSEVPKGANLLRIEGNARAILSAERTALNFLGRLCGIATLTREFGKALAGTQARIRDTRKTTPLLRTLEKYAVRMGGGVNHRVGLYDAILLKENHIAITGGVADAFRKATAYSPSLPVQVEVRNEAELLDALRAGAQSVLLDNMPVEEATRCVALAKKTAPGCVVEISGGITLANVRAYAETGADYLSSGALTHSARASDLSLLVETSGRT